MSSEDTCVSSVASKQTRPEDESLIQLDESDDAIDDAIFSCVAREGTAFNDQIGRWIYARGNRGKYCSAKEARVV